MGLADDVVGRALSPVVSRKYDLFLCYNWDDKSWANELHDALVRQELRVFKDDVSMRDWDGDRMPDIIRESLLGSRVLLPLITPHFHDSAHCRSELALALTNAYRLDAGSTRRVLPVTWRVRPSRVFPRQLVDGRKLLDREGRSTEELAARIAEITREIAESDARRFGDAPQHPGPVEWFPRPVPGGRSFYGRAEELWAVHDALHANDKPGDLGHPVVSVRGVGGLGKTALCERYAQWFPEDHPGGVFVIRLSGSDRRTPTSPPEVRAQFRRQLLRIAAHLPLPGFDPHTDDVVAVLARVLRDRPPYLWIVDDVPSTVTPDVLRELHAPTPDGRTLLTTRGRLHPVTREVPLAPLDSRTGLTLLTSQRAIEQDDRVARDAATDVVRELGGHALGLRAAAGLTTATSFGGYAALLAELRDTRSDVLELAQALANDLPVGYARAIAATLLRAHRTVGDAGRDLLAATSVLAAAPIPAAFVTDVLTRSGRSRWDASTTDATLLHLRDRGLVDVWQEDGTALYGTHALIHRAARTEADQTLRRRFRDTAMSVLTDAFAATRASISRNRTLTWHVPHALAVADSTEWPTAQGEWYLRNEVGRAESELGDSGASLTTFRRLLDSALAAPECDDDTRLRLSVQLGSAYAGHGEYSSALEVQEDALRRIGLMSAEPGAEPDELAELLFWTKNNLANTCVALGRREDARRLLTEVYRARRDSGGRSEPETLTALNNLVIAIGRGGRAELTDEQSHRIALRCALGSAVLWHRVAGERTRGTPDAVTSVGAHLLALGRPRPALDAFEYARRTYEHLLGPRHPDTIGAAENIATARRRLGAPEADDDAFWALFADRLTTQGPAHVNTARTSWRLVRDELVRWRPDVGPVDLPVVEVPDEAAVRNIRLDGDHAELFAEAVDMAVEWQDRETTEHGPDHPHSMMATVLLAYVLAAADQFDGQVDWARVLVADAREGLADVAARTPDELPPHALEIAETVHHWILHTLGEEPEY